MARKGGTVSSLNRSDLPPSTLEDSVNALVRAILFRDQSKEPFKKSEIVRLALVNTNQVDPIIWKQVERKVKDIFGLVLKKLDYPYDGLMILIKESSSRSVESCAPLNSSIHDGLLVVVLGIIFMSGGSLEENTLIDLLADLDIHLNTQVFLPGNRKVTVKDLLMSVWKKQMYLEINELRQQKKTFGWGQRACIEISKEGILSLMANIMNSRPEQWREQYRVAYGRDPGRFLTTNTGQVNIRPLNGPNTASQSQSRSTPQEVTIIDDADDDEEIQFLYDSGSRRSRSRAPLKPRNSVETKRQTLQSRWHH